MEKLEWIEPNKEDKSVQEYMKDWLNLKGIIGPFAGLSILVLINLLLMRRQFRIYGGMSEGVAFLDHSILGSIMMLMCLSAMVTYQFIELDEQKQMMPLTVNRLMAIQYTAILIAIYVIVLAVGEFGLTYWYAQTLMEQYPHSVMAYPFSWTGLFIGYSIQFGYGLMLLGLFTFLTVLYDRFVAIGFFGMLTCCAVLFFPPVLSQSVLFEDTSLLIFGLKVLLIYGLTIAGSLAMLRIKAGRVKDSFDRGIVVFFLLMSMFFVIDVYRDASMHHIPPVAEQQMYTVVFDEQQKIAAKEKGELAVSYAAHSRLPVNNITVEFSDHDEFYLEYGFRQDATNEVLHTDLLQERLEVNLDESTLHLEYMGNDNALLVFLAPNYQVNGIEQYGTSRYKRGTSNKQATVKLVVPRGIEVKVEEK